MKPEPLDSRTPLPPFRPARWLPGGHLQTLATTFQRRDVQPGESVRIPVDDGWLHGRWFAPADPTRGAALVVHGLGGDSLATFVTGTVQALQRRGLGALAIDLRGVGGSQSVEGAPLFHAGLTSDVRAAVRFVGERAARVHLIGFSLGGQLVLRTLGEWGAETPANIGSSATISPPVDLAAGASFTERLIAWPYRRVLVDGLHGRLRQAKTRLAPEILRAGLASTSVRTFDAAVIAPVFGFSGIDDYYAKTSCAAVAAGVAVPSLVLMADDDPVVPAAPVERLRANPRFRLERLATGGHCGFRAAGPAEGDASPWWAEERAAAWCLSHDGG